MATCNIDDLLAEGACFACLTDHELLVVIAALRCQTLQALDPMATCNVNDLLSAGACFGCLTDHQLLIGLAQLDCDVLDAIGGGGGGTFKQQFFVNAGDPNGVVNVPHDLPAQCEDTVNNIIWTREGGAPGDTGWDSP